MTETTRHARRPSGEGALSANDRREDRWSSRLAWSLMGAVVLHAALFLLRPGWDLPRLEPRGEAGAVRGDRLVATRLSSGGGGGRAVAPTVGEPSDSARERQDRPSVASGSRSGASNGSGSASRSLKDRLGDAGEPSLAGGGQADRRTPRKPPPRPEPDPETESSPGRSADGSGERPLSIGGRAATAAMTDTPSDDPPEFGRLRSLDPDVAVGLASSEVLLRNPSEVVRFKEMMVRRHPELARTEGWVSVAIWIDENGSVEWAEVSESSGREILDRAALELFTDVVAFRPALERGDRVPKSMLFYLLFPW